MKIKIRRGYRSAYAVAALLLTTALVLPSLLATKAFAFTALGGVVSSRAIYMTNSAVGATSTTYLVTFKPFSTTSLKGIILDFCAGSPVVGNATCAQPTGFTVGTP